MTLSTYNPSVYGRYASAVIHNTEFRTWEELEDAITRVGIVAFETCDFIGIDSSSKVLNRKWGTVRFSSCNFDAMDFSSAVIREDFHFTKCVFTGCDFSRSWWGQDLWVQDCQFAHCTADNHFVTAASVFTVTAATSWSLNQNYPATSMMWPWQMPQEESPAKKDEEDDKDLYGPDDCRTCGHTGEKRKMCMWCTRCNKLIWGC